MPNKDQENELKLANQMTGHVAFRTITGAGTILGQVSGFMVLAVPATFTADAIVTTTGSDVSINDTYEIVGQRVDLALENIAQSVGKVRWFFK